MIISDYILKSWKIDIGTHYIKCNVLSMENVDDWNAQKTSNKGSLEPESQVPWEQVEADLCSELYHSNSNDKNNDSTYSYSYFTN